VALVGGTRPHDCAARPGVLVAYHGGVIMPTATIKAIFWGTTWGTSAGDKITGTDTFYYGFNNSNYAKTIETSIG
jgi:hypothetical protein